MFKKQVRYPLYVFLVWTPTVIMRRQELRRRQVARSDSAHPSDDHHQNSSDIPWKYSWNSNSYQKTGGEEWLCSSEWRSSRWRWRGRKVRKCLKRLPLFVQFSHGGEFVREPGGELKTWVFILQFASEVQMSVCSSVRLLAQTCL